jgi:hypothetical protein
MIRALVDMHPQMHTHTYIHTHTHTHTHTKITLHIPCAPTCFGQLCGHHQGYNVSNLRIFYRHNPDDSHIVGRTWRYELIPVYMCAHVGAIIVCTSVYNLCITYLFIYFNAVSLTMLSVIPPVQREDDNEQWIRKDKEGCTLILTEGFILVFAWRVGQELGNTSEHLASHSNF